MSALTFDERTIPFVPYPDAVKILRALSEFRKHESGRDRPRCLHIVAASGMGKSRLLRHYMQQICRDRSSQGLKPREALLVETPFDGDYRELCRLIVDSCLPGYPLGRGPRLSALTTHALQVTGVRQLLLDEAGHALNTGRGGQQRLLGLLKSISNLGVTVAVATTVNLANAMAADEQLHSRFTRIDIPIWRESMELRQFLCGIERLLSLPRPSHLDSMATVRWFVVNQCLTTENLIGVILGAARLAKQENEPHLSVGLLEQAWITRQFRDEEVA